MKKIALDLEMLAVESFQTSAAERGEGTVHGHEAPPSQGGSDCLRTACCPNTYQATCTCA